MNAWKIKQLHPNISGIENKGLPSGIQWNILKRSTTANCIDGRCKLGLEKKKQIMLYPDPGNLLNKTWLDVGIEINLDYSKKN